MEGNRELCLEWEGKCLAGAAGAILGVFGRDDANKRLCPEALSFISDLGCKAGELGSCIYFQNQRKKVCVSSDCPQPEKSNMLLAGIFATGAW